jgi:3-deoxy-D-manno-octulosonic-acid transferase
MLYFTYTLSLMLGLAIALPHYLIRFGKYFPTLADRLGFLKLPQLHRSIWVHAVSVGEFKAVEPLLERLRCQFPGRTLVVSTTTPAGQDVARERRDIVDHICCFPIDLPWCVRRALDRIAPETVIIAETEIWPNFLRACRARGVRVLMINGRISDKSFARYKYVRRWLGRVLDDYAIIGMQSETDRKRIEALGANPQKVSVFGNLKYDVTLASPSLDPELENLLAGWKEVWIAASTMAGEEEYVLNAYKQVKATRPRLTLVIAPRHPNRFNAVFEIVKESGLDVVRRSEIGDSGGARTAGTSSASVLLLDSMGELSAVFRYATLVFMGGSIAATGGHNILEPARHGKPVIFGPHMENFRDMSRLFLEAKAAVQIQTPAELAPTVSDLLSNAERASQIGRSAAAVVQQNAGATDRVLRVLEPVGASR